jgi:hypothetical protein
MHLDCQNISIDNIMDNYVIEINQLDNYVIEINQLDNEIKILEKRNLILNENISNYFFCCYCLINKIDIQKFSYNLITINYLEEQKLQIKDKIELLKKRDYEMC